MLLMYSSPLQFPPNFTPDEPPLHEPQQNGGMETQSAADAASEQPTTATEEAPNLREKGIILAALQRQLEKRFTEDQQLHSLFLALVLHIYRSALPHSHSHSDHSDF